MQKLKVMRLKGYEVREAHNLTLDKASLQN